jgi:4-diphosphocytidyl-2-C-methyl-D-erythritol kinase
MFALGINTEQLEAYATKLGADCPFFITSTPVYATGIGNEFHPITLDLGGLYLVVVKPDVFVSTKEAYSMVKPEKPAVTLDEKIVRPIAEWRDTISNDFEKGIFALHPELEGIKSKLYELGALYAAMSGSGSALFGLFEAPVEKVESHFEGCFCEQQKLPDSHRGASK